MKIDVYHSVYLVFLNHCEHGGGKSSGKPNRTFFDTSSEVEKNAKGVSETFFDDFSMESTKVQKSFRNVQIIFFLVFFEKENFSLEKASESRLLTS